MRMWSIHPRYLDVKGLNAAWCEGVLAQQVLRGLTRGWTKHTQLDRFRAHEAPLDAIAEYLRAVHAEGIRRGYNYNPSRIHAPPPATRVPRIAVPRGQVEFEWETLQRRLRQRAPSVAEAWAGVTMPEVAPLFVEVEGGVAEWEKSVEADAVRARELEKQQQQSPVDLGRLNVVKLLEEEGISAAPATGRKSQGAKAGKLASVKGTRPTASKKGSNNAPRMQ